MSHTNRPPAFPRPFPTVLVVDDEATARSETCRLVRALGYRAETARDGREALRYLRQQPGEVHLVLTDLIMPAMDGGELLERAHDLAPRLPVVLMSASLEGHAGELAAAYPEAPFLEKPVTYTKLAAVLRWLIGPPLGGGTGAGCPSGAEAGMITPQESCPHFCHQWTDRGGASEAEHLYK